MNGINAFFRDVLGASFANARWSWGGVDHDRRRVFLRVWRDDIRHADGRRWIRVLRTSQSHSRPGWNERVRHIELVKSGYQAYGVLCDREHAEAGAITGFDADELLVFGAATEADDAVRLEIVATLPTTELMLPPDRAEALVVDLQEVACAPLPETTRAALVEARLGQGRYRQQLLKAWGNACAVTGCTVQAALRASHCKPWRDSDNAERLDAANGLLLVATLDALFDSGLIAFDDDGTMQVSPVLHPEECDMLGVPAPLRRRPTPAQVRYLQHHRERLFITKPPVDRLQSRPASRNA